MSNKDYIYPPEWFIVRAVSCHQLHSSDKFEGLGEKLARNHGFLVDDEVRAH
ncbi:hypothetical protein HYDPIDRAFT_115109 [Hydnomerulius pinastri MD-312]|uniref:Uncharacterized protein n=1 Tax=Hydnomerulius pinastri MD-312 TaxID=994086 RepID=A0A0C9W5J2_9AGAM|nr:hypothetical protein HYDPIDRAFT_115109 [Hydnomerulius pinastri MD-312]